jgi:tRNA pseudouridine38-40 synthase
MMTRHKLTFEYDGTHFRGWQRQPEERTVQGVVETALSTLYQQKIEIAGQGRTDAGVHAKGQTAHADLPDRFENRRILHAMRGLLPPDVALLQIEKTSPDFHARFDAVSRTYSYHLLTRPSPLTRHISWYHHAVMKEEALNRCAGMIIGTHDFVNFCIPAEDPHQTTTCIITKSFWKKRDKSWCYGITGSRFLRHMVRRLVGSMVQVNDGKISVEEFEEMLSGPASHQKGHSAPASGLILEKVQY